MSRAEKRHAMRLYLYLQAAGQAPTLVGANYLELS